MNDLKITTRKWGDITKDAYYFSHDSNAKDDPKCVALIDQMGLEGYGIFWVLVETLRDQPDYMYPIELIPALSRRYNTTSAKMRTVIEKYGLFTITDDNKFFFSYSLNRRMLKANEKRDKLRANALKRWHGEDDTKAMQLHSKSNADLMPVKERKVNESKLNSTTTACARACEDDDEKKNDVAQSLVNSDLAAVNRYWDENVSPITPAIAREFSAMLQKGFKAEIITAAIKEGVESVLRPNFKYVKTILDRWAAQGIDTAAKVKEDSEKRQKPQNRAKQPDYSDPARYAGEKEELPSWATK